MKRIYCLCVFFLLPLFIFGQELTVKEMKATNDLSASQYRRKDLSGEACALVKVQLATSDVGFEGNVIQPVEYKGGEYWVYMTKGSRELHIKHLAKSPAFVPCHISFSDYDIKNLESLTTYNITLLLPQRTATKQTQKLTINYSPVNAIVLVDSEPHQGNGNIELTLPIGTHSYQIIAMGYETAEGSVKLTTGQPRIITEHLAAKVQQPTQQSVIEKEHANYSPTPVVQQQTVEPQTQLHSFSGLAVETITIYGVSFNMVRVDGGMFTMGATSERDSDAESDEKPVHQVTLSSYYIGETEVTQELWQTVMGSNPSNFKGSQRPVERVSWDDCQEFIRKLNEKTGRQFRLPTEAEWEFAARGGNKSRGYQYSGSNKLKDVAWYSDNNGASTRDVKTKQANELGIYDMSGNVEEWCQDWFVKYQNNSQTNPTGPLSGASRVYRGGSWISYAMHCRVAIRCCHAPDYHFDGLGLRLVFQ